MMKNILLAAALVIASSAATIPDVLAAPHTYQVTGQVLEVTDKAIVISKGKENWEIARDAKTKLPESVKPGSKITIEYSMTALDVTDKTQTKKDSKKK